MPRRSSVPNDDDQGDRNTRESNEPPRTNQSSLNF